MLSLNMYLQTSYFFPTKYQYLYLIQLKVSVFQTGLIITTNNLHKTHPFCFPGLLNSTTTYSVIYVRNLGTILSSFSPIHSSFSLTPQIKSKCSSTYFLIHSYSALSLHPHSHHLRSLYCLYLKSHYSSPTSPFAARVTCTLPPSSLQH